MVENETTDVHEAIIEIHLSCYDLNDRYFLSSEIVDKDFFEKYPDLKPGDKVQYRIDDETNDIVILNRVLTKKTIIPIKN